MPVPLIRPAAAAVLLLGGCNGREKPEQANGVASNAAAPVAPAGASAPPAAPHTSPWSASGYALNGTEPFWGGSVTGTNVRYMTPEDQFGDVVDTTVSFAADRETYSGRHDGHPFVLTLVRGACSDGMSDRTYAFSATLQVDGGTRRGCADPQ